MSANEQWRTRPADQRYTSLTELAAAMHNYMEHSAAKVVPSKSLEAGVQNGKLVIGRNGNTAEPTNWAFGQLCSRVTVPAGYMRDIRPLELVADCVNEGIMRRDVEDMGLLLYKDGGPTYLTACTGPNYGRIWNARLADALVSAFGDGLTGRIKVPGEFGQPTVITKENTTLYASDRDMVVFLADESRSLDVKNRRDGKTGHLSHGIAVGNSDVGGGTLWLARFIFDFFCSNRIIWGLEQVEELRIRHTVGAPHRFLSEVVPILDRFARENVTLKQAQIDAAQERRVADLDEFLLKRKFTRSQVSGMKAAFETDEGSKLVDDCSVWDTVVAATAYARRLQYQDQRVAIEREAGRMLLAAK
ncbi:MAG TPA: DUF932 domain-containing protein [Xanthobacteraceae bacterium]